MPLSSFTLLCMKRMFFPSNCFNCSPLYYSPTLYYSPLTRHFSIYAPHFSINFLV